MNYQAPLVSVISPCYNRGNLIEEMIKSILNQTYTNWELLLVDDGSDESTIQLLRKYTDVDSRIHLIRRTNEKKGACSCRNIGFMASKGDYVIFLDSDDFLSPVALSQRVDFIEKKNLDFAVFIGFVYQEVIVGKLIQKKEKDIARILLKLEPYCIPGAVMIKKTSLVNSNILWDENIKSFQDIDFFLSLSLRCVNYDTADGLPPDFFWRKHKMGNIGDKLTSIKHIESHQYLYKKMYAVIVSNDEWFKKYGPDLRLWGGKLLIIYFGNGDYKVSEALFEALRTVDNIYSTINISFFRWCAKNYCKHKLIVRTALYLIYPNIFGIPPKRRIFKK